MNIYRAIITVLLLLILLVLLQLPFFNLKHSYDKDIDVLEHKIDSINYLNYDLKFKIDSIDNVNNLFMFKIDSFKRVKPKIKIEYVTKYKEIDNLSSNELILLSDSIFTANGIK